jgi:Cu/Ag efflux protein CusF
MEASMKKRLTIYLFLLTMFCGIAAAASAQSAITKAGNVSKSATITAINHSTRVVTLKDAKGNVEDIQCGPEITRFNELKVGDTVTFSYHAAVAYEIVKPGDKSAAAAGASITRGQGTRPSGAVTQQMKASVTVEAIDSAAPSVTVRTADGHRMTAMVEDRKNLEGLKVGDKIDMTFTEALMVTVESAKK